MQNNEQKIIFSNPVFFSNTNCNTGAINRKNADIWCICAKNGISGFVLVGNRDKNNNENPNNSVS